MRLHQPPPAPHMKGDNRRQRETRPLQSPRRRPHQPTPTPHNRRQWETTGDKTTSEPKKPTTPTNTKAARSQVALRTPTVNCLGNNACDRSFFQGTMSRHVKATQGWENLLYTAHHLKVYRIGHSSNLSTNHFFCSKFNESQAIAQFH